MPLIARVYASVEDYVEMTGQAPDDVDDLNRRLARASLIVEELTMTATYSTDDDRMPTDPDVKLAMTLATCAQADWFGETGDISGAAGQTGSMSIGSLSIGARKDGAGSQSAAQSRYAPEAISILSTRGLCPSGVGYGGPSL